jgi:hypothetical protein
MIKFKFIRLKKDEAASCKTCFYGKNVSEADISCGKCQARDMMIITCHKCGFENVVSQNYGPVAGPGTCKKCREFFPYSIPEFTKTEVSDSRLWWHLRTY